MRKRICLGLALLPSLMILTSGCGKKKAVDPIAILEPAPEQAKPATEVDKSWDKSLADLRGKSVERRAAAIQNITRYDAATAIPALLNLLDDKGFTEGAILIGIPNSTREAAIIALLKLGPAGEKAALEKGAPVLSVALSHPNADVREHAILAFALLGPKANTSADFLKACADPADNVRRAAYDALSKTGSLQATSLMPLLVHADAKIIYDAARQLNAIEKLPKEIIPLLIDALKKPVADKEKDEATLARLDVAEALASFGKEAEPAIPVLMELLQATSEEDFIKFYRQRSNSGLEESPVMMALRKIGQPAVAPLMAAADSNKNFVRWQATQVLAGMGPDAKEALPTLQATFDKEFERKDANFNVMATTAVAVVQLGGDPAPIITKMTALLDNPNDAIRYEALRIFARFGRKGAGALNAVVRMLNDLEKQVQEQAVKTIQAFGPAAKEAVPALAAKLADPEFNVRRSAAAALRTLGPLSVEATPLLINQLSEMDDALRREVIETLTAIGPGAKAAGPNLAKSVKSPDGRESALAIQALAAIEADPKEVSAELIAALNAKDAETRRSRGHHAWQDRRQLA